MKIKITVLVSIVFFVCGCKPEQNLALRITELENKHNVEIEVDSYSNPKELSSLLNRIDSDLDLCSPFFKTNIGPIYINDSFKELNKGFLLAGYVDGGDFWDGFPIHIKKRSVLDKILFPVPREKDVFLHEAGHSFELNIKAEVSNRWEKFEQLFNNAQVIGYDTSAPLQRTLFTFVSRPKSMPSNYGRSNHYEDFAETNCYLKRNDIEKIKESDPVLYYKCKLVEQFVLSGTVSDEPYSAAIENNFGSLENSSMY